jgi:hypothetical protein
LKTSASFEKPISSYFTILSQAMSE